MGGFEARTKAKKRGASKQRRPCGTAPQKKRRIRGTRLQVVNRVGCKATRVKTAGGLTADKFMRHPTTGRWVSKARRLNALKNLEANPGHGFIRYIKMLNPNWKPR